ncbi:MAG: hypothetical protein IPN62_19110 [Flavobacteriales bacterium]|nr:hypothetical protein [Flavobacteriales bacterium]
MRILRIIAACIVGALLSVGIFFILGFLIDLTSGFGLILTAIISIATLMLAGFLCAVPMGLATAIMGENDQGELETSGMVWVAGALMLSAVALAIYSVQADGIGTRWPIWMGLLVYGVVGLAAKD